MPGLFGNGLTVGVSLLTVILIGHLQGHCAGVPPQHNAVVGDNGRAVDGVRVVVHQIARVKFHGVTQYLFLLPGIGMVGAFLYALRVVGAAGKAVGGVMRRNELRRLPHLIPGLLTALLPHQ